MLHGQRLAGWNENSFSIGLVSIGESVHQQWTQEVIILTFVSIDAFQLCLVCFPWRLLRFFLHHICLVCFWLWTLKDFALFFQGVGEARMSLDLASLFLRVGWKREPYPERHLDAQSNHSPCHSSSHLWPHRVVYTMLYRFWSFDAKLQSSAPDIIIFWQKSDQGATEKRLTLS